MPSPTSTERLVTRLLQGPTNIGRSPINTGDKILETIEGGLFGLQIEVAAFTQAVTTADLNFGRQIFTFAKAGRLKIVQARVDVSLVSDGVATLVNGEVGLGTALASGAADTLASTEENLFAGGNATFTAVAAGATERVQGTDIDKTAVDATSAAPSIYLNVGIDGGVAGDFTVSGTVEVIGHFVPVHD